ncbi:MAG: hypothetical protein PHG66_04435 [Candidatus Colwellbacteria bacterium]|nr:hypothetical protein [Candidatus Colwellbacteria bacterium]
MNYQNLYVNFILLMQCMWELPKIYYMLFAENYHLFPMIPAFMPVSNSPRLWLVVHLILALLVSYKVGCQVISKEKNLGVLFGFFSLIVLINCWNFGTASAMVAIIIQVTLLVAIGKEFQNGYDFITFVLLTIPSILTTVIVFSHIPSSTYETHLVLCRCAITGVCVFLFEISCTGRKLI